MVVVGSWFSVLVLANVAVMVKLDLPGGTPATKQFTGGAPVSLSDVKEIW